MDSLPLFLPGIPVGTNADEFCQFFPPQPGGSSRACAGSNSDLIGLKGRMSAPSSALVEFFVIRPAQILRGHKMSHAFTIAKDLP